MYMHPVQVHVVQHQNVASGCCICSLHDALWMLLSWRLQYIGGIYPTGCDRPNPVGLLEDSWIRRKCTCILRGRAVGRLRRQLQSLLLQAGICRLCWLNSGCSHVPARLGMVCCYHCGASWWRVLRCLRILLLDLLSKLLFACVGSMIGDVAIMMEQLAGCFSRASTVSCKVSSGCPVPDKDAPPSVHSCSTDHSMALAV
jgi:hypothetical protein